MNNKRTHKKVVSMALASSLALCTGLGAAAYTVQQGDTLSKIAKANGTTVEEILRLNNLDNPDMIFPGTDINLSGAKTTAGTIGEIYSRVALSATDEALLKGDFDAEWYAKNNPDVAKVYGDDPEKLFEHFKTYGLWEGRPLNENFDVNAYGSSYGDLTDAFSELSPAAKVLALTEHYLTYGKTENRTITTIPAAIAAGVTVRYQGSYAEDEPGKEILHIMAEPTPTAPAPAPQGQALLHDILLNFAKQMGPMIYQLIDDYDLQDQTELADIMTYKPTDFNDESQISAVIPYLSYRNLTRAATSKYGTGSAEATAYINSLDGVLNIIRSWYLENFSNAEADMTNCLLTGQISYTYPDYVAYVRATNAYNLGLKAIYDQYAGPGDHFLRLQYVTDPDSAYDTDHTAWVNGTYEENYEPKREYYLTAPTPDGADRSTKRSEYESANTRPDAVDYMGVVIYLIAG